MVKVDNLSPEGLVAESSAALATAVNDAVRAACKGGLVGAIGVLVMQRPDGAVTVRVSVNGSDTFRGCSPRGVR